MALLRHELIYFKTPQKLPILRCKGMRRGSYASEIESHVVVKLSELALYCKCVVLPLSLVESLL